MKQEVTENNPHPLNYAIPPEVRIWPMWVHIIALFVWPFVAIGIWAIAILCPILAVMGAIGIFYPIPGFPPENHHAVVLPGDRWRWIAYNMILSVIFVPVARWHLRWRRKSNSEEN